MARIVDYQETTTPADNDILLIETEDGTRKVKKSVLLKAVLDLIGNTDISNIGDGTTTGAISAVNQKVASNDDEYSSSKNYAVGEHCIYNNKLYKCITACSAASWNVNQNCFSDTTLTREIPTFSLSGTTLTIATQ